MVPFLLKLFLNVAFYLCSALRLPLVWWLLLHIRTFGERAT